MDFRFRWKSGHAAAYRRTARPHPEDRRFRGEREGGAVRGRGRTQGQTLLGARKGHWRRGLPAADDDPQHLFPHRDGLRHPATTAPMSARWIFLVLSIWSTPDRSRCAIQTAEMWGNVC